MNNQKMTPGAPEKPANLSTRVAGLGLRAFRRRAGGRQSGNVGRHPQRLTRSKRVVTQEIYERKSR